MNYIKRLIISLLSIVLIITPNLSFAFATDEWDKKYKYDKGGVVVAGTKGDLISRIKIPSSASKIGKFIGKGGHNALIGLALTEMLGKAVDFTLDTQNNTIKYKTDSNRCRSSYGGVGTLQQIAPLSCERMNGGQYSGYELLYANTYKIDCSGRGSDVAYCETGEEQIKTLDEIANQLKKLAEHGNKQAQKLQEEIVKEMGKNKELEKDLDKNAKDRKKEEQNCLKRLLKLDPISLLCVPDFDDDEPKSDTDHCDKCQILREIEDNTEQTAQNTQEIKESTNAIKEKLQDLFDFLKDDNIPENNDGQVDVQDLAKDLKIDENRIRIAQNQCPPPKQVTINVGLVTQTYEYNYQPMCDFFAKLRPFVIATASLSAILIIGGIRRG